jgi:hypothetical protein
VCVLDRAITHQSIVKDIDANTRQLFTNLQYVQLARACVLAWAATSVVGGWVGGGYGCMHSTFVRRWLSPTRARKHIDEQRVAMESLRRHRYNPVNILTEERKAVEQVAIAAATYPYPLPVPPSPYPSLTHTKTHRSTSLHTTTCHLEPSFYPLNGSPAVVRFLSCLPRLVRSWQ